jgi:group I intron endonuclease
MKYVKFPSDKFLTLCIYTITNKVTGMVYVGKTKRPAAERWTEHTGKNRATSSYISRAITKYGKHNFEFSVIDHAENESMLSHKESFWIKQLDSMAPKGYNLMEKHLGGHRTEAEKAHLSKVCTGNPRQVTRSDGEVFVSIKIAAEKSGMTASSLTKILSGIRHSVNGFQFKYGEHSSWGVPTKVRKTPNTRKVIRSDGKVFESIAAATKETGCNRSAIFKVLANTHKYAHGYSFKYYTEE